MTREQLEQQYLKIDGMLITPEYKINILQQETKDEETGEIKIIDIEDYIITKSAQQVYDNGMERKNNPLPPQPNQQDTLNAQLLKDNASMKVEINNQKALNSQLLLEIAKLKGGTANV